MITQDQLTTAIKLAYPNGVTRRYPPRAAFISESAYSVGDQAFPAVVTADYLDRSSGTFEIVFDMLGWTAGGYDPISLTIDDSDIRAVREMLGIGHEVAPMAMAWEDDLAVAMKTLRLIASMEETKQVPEDSWRETIFRTIELAANTLERIEAGHGTSSDS